MATVTQSRSRECSMAGSEAINLHEKNEKIDYFVTSFLAMTPIIAEVLIEKLNDRMINHPIDTAPFAFATFHPCHSCHSCFFSLETSQP